MTAAVVLADPEPSGLAAMLAGLIEQNLVRDPTRERILRPSLVSICAPDAGVAATLRIDPRRILVVDGPVQAAHLRIVADSDRLLALTAVPLRFGLPDVLSHEGRAVLGDLARGRVRIAGMFRHPNRLIRLTKLLSVR